MDSNKEKLKSINYWLRYYHLFNVDEEWLVNHIREIAKAETWECMKEHTEAGLIHERQLAHLIHEDGHVPKLYKA